MERVDYLERLKQEYCLTYLKVQRLTKELAGAIRGTLVKKKVGKYSYYDLQVWEEADVCAQGRGGANPEPDRGATPSGGRTERPEEVSGGTAKMSAAFSSERGGSDGEL